MARRRAGRRTAALAAALAALLWAGCGGEGEQAPPPSTAEPSGEAGAEATAAGTESRPVSVRGGERLLLFGDSLSVEGPPTFADRLPAALAPKAEGIRVENVSVPGSTSDDWRPGGELFERGLGPRLRGADVVLVTIGGNDLQAALDGGDGPDALSRVGGADEVRALGQALRQIERNLARTFAAIREASPATRIVFVGYPDYSRSSVWRESGGSLAAIGLRLGLERLNEAARSAGPDAALDMLAATGGRDVDRLLSDGEHLSAAGHRLYARAIATELTR